MSRQGKPDPMETALESFLNELGIPFMRDDAESGLDFFLPGYKIYIEVKQFHTPRISDQMKRRPNVIAIQGMEAMKAFCRFNKVELTCPIVSQNQPVETLKTKNHTRLPETTKTHW